MDWDEDVPNEAIAVDNDDDDDMELDNSMDWQASLPATTTTDCQSMDWCATLTDNISLDTADMEL